MPGNLCSTELPELGLGRAGPNHTKRCHLANPDAIYETEVLPEIAPDLVELTIADQPHRPPTSPAATSDARRPGPLRPRTR